MNDLRRRLRVEPDRSRRRTGLPLPLSLLLLLLLPGCAADGGRGAGTDPDPAVDPAVLDAPWVVEAFGALRPLLHEGRTGTVVELDALLPDDELYAVGALTDLDGEITVVGGEAYLSRATGAEDSRTTATREPDAGATLLVAARVPAWQDVPVTEPIGFEELDARIAELAAAAGLDTEARIPFLITGEVEDLAWHVIDGSRLPPGPSSHAAHQAAGVRAGRPATDATLVGFYSPHDEGVFTHRGSSTHVHCVVTEPLSGGHVDHVTIPAGAVLHFPDSPR